MMGIITVKSCHVDMIISKDKYSSGREAESFLRSWQWLTC